MASPRPASQRFKYANTGEGGKRHGAVSNLELDGVAGTGTTALVESRHRVIAKSKGYQLLSCVSRRTVCSHRRSTCGNADAEQIQRHEWISGPTSFQPSELTIPDGDWIDSGLLKCWTSTSTAYILSPSHEEEILDRKQAVFQSNTRDASLGEMLYGDTISEEVIADLDTAYLFHVLATPYMPYNPLRSERDAIKKNIMVIACSGETPDVASNLSCTLFDRVDGVAYRVGIAQISDREWVRMERRWELVTLG